MQDAKTFDDVKIRAILSEKEILKNKKTMPFVQEFKKKVEKYGLVTFSRELSFNEYETLFAVKEFFRRNLGYKRVIVMRGIFAKEEEEKRAVELAVPGEPGILFKNVDPE